MSQSSMSVLVVASTGRLSIPKQMHVKSEVGAASIVETQPSVPESVEERRIIMEGTGLPWFYLNPVMVRSVP